MQTHLPTAAATADDLLKATARSFYLSLRVLPAAVRPQIGLAYLLARTSDTVADTEIVPVDLRLDFLQQLRERMAGRSSQPLDFSNLAQHQGAPAERLLLERAEESIAALKALSGPDRELVRNVLEIITSGQELDLRRFAGAAAEKIIALETASELDDYTYRVAGCVGEFWTRLCRAHLFPETRLNEEQFLADAARFGKGLQLVNILRDLPADLKQGRCYLPLEKLTPRGLSPENMLRPAHQEKFLALYQAHLDLAEGHLAAGWRYTNTVPFGQFGVRLACAWPILLGAKTIAKLRVADVPALTRRVKVSRGEVYWTMVASCAASPAPFLWRRLFAGANEVASGRKLA